MSDPFALQRAAVVAEARRWIGTPYHHGAGVRGAGVDCLYLLARVYEAAGAIARPEIPPYPCDWHLHRSAERYLAGLLAHAREIAGPPLPGDAVLWRFGRCFSHGAIVTAWPRVIHAYLGRAVAEEDAEAAQWLSFIGESAAHGLRPRPRRFFSPWGAA